MLHISRWKLRTITSVIALSAALASPLPSFAAGKTISADADAIASARVMGCCLATGAAAGNLAVSYLSCTK